MRPEQIGRLAVQHFKYKDNAFINRSNYVTHRERNVIPGCVPAVDVFVTRTLEEVREYLAPKTAQYSEAVKTYVESENKIGGAGEKEMWFNAMKGNMPLVVIRNPAKLSKYM